MLVLRSSARGTLQKIRCCYSKFGRETPDLPEPAEEPDDPFGRPWLLSGRHWLLSGILHNYGCCRPDGDLLESFDVFQSVNDPSADFQTDRTCLGPSPSFMGAGRDPPAERKFSLIEMGNAQVVSPQWHGTSMPTSEITGRAASAIALSQHAHSRSVIARHGIARAPPGRGFGSRDTQT